MRPGLEPDVNVDIVDIQKGIQAALDFGYATKPEDRMVVEYCLQRHARGEEEGSVKSWLSHFGKGELTGWYMVMASAIQKYEEA